MTVVEIHTTQLHRNFGSITALDGVDLHIDEPEIIGLVGPNGAGKTTLIACLLGLLEPTAGSATLDGVPATELSTTDRSRIGYMPQEEAIYRDLTIRENVAFFARLYGVENRRAAIDDAIEQVALRPRQHARIGELSGGMVRRTSLACTLVTDPDVAFLDEPTVGLDPQLRTGLWTRFRQLREAGGVVLVSTHYLGEAHRCDRVLFLRDGRVLAFDTPDRLLDRSGAGTLEEAFLSLVSEDGPSDGDKPAELSGVDDGRDRR